MRRFVLSLTAFILLVSCENSADPLSGIFGGGGGAITQAQASGNWSITVTRTTTLACSGALADGQVITVHADVLAGGTLSTTTSTWLNPISGTVQALTGSVRFSDGFTDFTFTAPTSAGMELRGTMTGGGALTGTLTDPAAGLSQVFGTDGCQYTVTGTKTG